MGKTQYQAKWATEFPWLSPALDKFKAYCNICKREFKICGSGRSQVVCHQRCHSTKDGGENTKKKPASNAGQMVFSTTNVMQKGKMSELSIDDQVLRAETYQALKVVGANYCFASTNNDSELFKLMFPNHPVSERYSMAETKVKYVVQLGIAPYCKEVIMDDLRK